MKYIEISAMGGVSILKKKNINMVSCHAPTGSILPASKLYHIKIQLKIGEPLIGFYQTEEKMMEEYQNIFNKLSNN
jgi:hypothetical protein